MAEKADIKRILVALDPSESGREALAAGVEMAARLQAELVGVYVEDIDLLQMAGLPFAREYSVEAVEGRHVDPEAMVRAFRGQAGRLRRAIESIASREHVRWSFRVARGQVARELMAASEDVDMVVVGKATYSTSGRVRVGSTTRTIVTSGTRTVVVMHRGGMVTRPVLVWFDGSRSAIRALATAARLAAEDQKNIVVLIAATDEKAAAKARRTAAKLLEEVSLTARYVRCDHLDAAAVIAAMRAERCRTLVIAADSPLLSEGATTGVLEKLDCPVVLVR